MEDEIFGPILPILTYSDLGELLAKIKSLPKPLAGYVFSRNQQAIDQVLRSLSFGGGAVNQTNVFLFIETMPYGGVLASATTTEGMDSSPLRMPNPFLSPHPTYLSTTYFLPTRWKRCRRLANGSDTRPGSTNSGQ
jgi:acyl-CoA reductase-like NAD-dependent aldehyde dehydrogenase